MSRSTTRTVNPGWSPSAAGCANGTRPATGCVVSCSALKRRYRDALRAACPHAFFLHLTARPELLAERIGHRTGHFMPEVLLDSQLATLEPLEPDERGAELDATPDPDTIVDMATAVLPTS